MLIQIFILTIACEQEADLAIPEEPNKLTVYSSFGADADSTWMLFVSKSKSILDMTPIEDLGISNAQIEILEDGILLPQAELVDTQQYFRSIGIGAPIPLTGVYRMNNVTPKAGSQYELSIQADNLIEIESKTVIPGKVELLDAEIVLSVVKIKDVVNGNGISAKVRLKDPGNTNNFYQLFVEVSRFSDGLNFSEKNLVQIVVNNPELSLDTSEDDLLFSSTPRSDGVLFRDVVFNGLEYEINFFMASPSLVSFIQDPEHFGNQKFKISFSLRNLTEENYWYHVTTRLQSAVRNDPFAEPIQIRSNVNDGFGLFGGFNQDRIVVEIE